MIRVRPWVLAIVSVIVVAVIGIWGWSMAPDRAFRWAFVVFFLPVLWGAVELLQGGCGRRREIMDWHRLVIAGVGLLMAFKVGGQLAILTGWMDAGWGPIIRRAAGVLFGLFLAIWGNYLPKLISPWRPEEEWFDWQRVHRFVGWVATLCGIALMVVWLALPLESAKPAALVIVVAYMVLGVGRKFLSAATYSRR